MATRTDIITLLKFQLNAINNVAVFGNFKFIDQINNFPTICLDVSMDRIRNLESNYIDHSAFISIRGYVRAEDSISSCDTLAHDIETIIQSINDNLVVDIKVESVSSDEGLFAPFGILDINATIDYKHLTQVIQLADSLLLITQIGNFIVTQDGNYMLTN